MTLWIAKTRQNMCKTGQSQVGEDGQKKAGLPAHFANAGAGKTPLAD
jgi:hypothetical protein